MNSEFIREQLKSFYDQSADDFSRTRGNWWKDLDFIKEHIPQNGKVLDFGCGNGRFLKFLEKINFNGRYEGVDISEKLIQLAKIEYPAENFQTIEREDQLPFKGGEFDAVMTLAVFHHFNPQMAGETLRELKRILKKDGVLILTVWHLWNKKYLKFLFNNFKTGNFNLSASVSFQSGTKKYWRYCYWWRLKSLARIIEKSGFDITDSGFTFDLKGKKRNLYFIAKVRS